MDALLLPHGMMLRVAEGHAPMLVTCEDGEHAGPPGRHAAGLEALADSRSEGDGELSCVSSESSEDAHGFFSVGTPSATEVIFVREGVAVRPSKTVRIPGRLSLVKQHCVVFMTCRLRCLAKHAVSGIRYRRLPYSHGVLQEDGTFQTTSPGSPGQSGYAIHPIAVSDIRALRKHTPRFGGHWLAVTLLSGITLPPFNFQGKGGVAALLETLSQHVPLVRSTEQPSTFLVNDVADPVPRTLTPLDLGDVLLGGPPAGGASTTFAPPPPAHVAAAQSQPSGSTSTWAGWAEHAECVWDRDNEPQGGSNSAASGSGGGGAWSRIYSTVEGMVTRLAQEFAPPLSTSQQWFNQWSAVGLHWDSFSEVQAGELIERTHIINPTGTARGEGEDAGLRQSGAGGPGMAAATVSHGVAQTSTLAADTVDDDFELVEMGEEEQCRMLGGAHTVQQPPLSIDEWHVMHDAEGRLTCVTDLYVRAFSSGLCHDVRRDAWRYLLGLHAPASSTEQRRRAAANRRTEYQTLLKQWQSIGPTQAARHSHWRERKTRVEKDVRRTDRAHPFFAAEGGPATKALQRILLTYAIYNFDLGYCQGMSDIAAPMLVVLRDESEAFWAFATLMERMGANFDSDQAAMHAQLLAVKQLMQLLDPQLYAHLEQADALSFFFTFRWLLIHFKREFAFDDVLRLWEALWTAPSTPHMHLYLCCAILVHHRRAILHEVHDMDSCMRFCLSLSGHLELDSLLKLATLLAQRVGVAGAECCEKLPVSCQQPPTSHVAGGVESVDESAAED